MCHGVTQWAIYSYGMKNINLLNASSGSVGLGTLIGLGIIIFAGFYVASAPFRTKVDRKVESIATWTPEQIQRDPSGYLRWAEVQVGELQNQVGARQLDLLKQREIARKQTTDAERELTNTKRLLEEAKTAYRNNRWPAKLRNQELSHEEAIELMLLLREQSEFLLSQNASLSEREQMLAEGIAALGAASFKVGALLVRVQHVAILQSTSGLAGSGATIGRQIDDLTATVVALQSVLPGSLLQTITGDDTAERDARINNILAE